MQVSRAVKQLTTLDLMSARKDGVRTVISGRERRLDLYNKARPYLLNPVRKKLYVERMDLPEGLPLSGYSALSELTMLGSPEMETLAFFGRIGKLFGTGALIDNAKQAEVEIWRYDPVLLSRRSGVVDALSLVVSLSPGEDPRIEQAIDDLLSQVWR